MMKVILASPRGFCAGVRRAIEIVELALEKYGPPIYVRHEIVHNKYVVKKLTEKGVIFVKEVEEIPPGSITIYSAHGVSKQVENQSATRSLKVINATCPLVTKVHNAIVRNDLLKKQIILIGHHNHPEVEGTAGRIANEVIVISSLKEVEQLTVDDPNNLAYLTQTTLSVDETHEIILALKRRYPSISGPQLQDICYATQNRQNAIKKLVDYVDLILVIGSKNSSNSNRLKDLASSLGVPAYLIDDSTDIKPEWLKNIQTIGITAGASAPEALVEEVLTYLANTYSIEVEILDGIIEKINFQLPKELTA